jgi:hypothetical protein
MAQTQPPHLWGKLKRNKATKPCPDRPGFVQLVIDGNVAEPVVVSVLDSGLSHLSPYRIGKKKVLILLWQSPNKTNHIFAVYVTDSERLVRQIFAITQDSANLDDPLKKILFAKLREKRPRYMASLQL